MNKKFHNYLYTLLRWHAFLKSPQTHLTIPKNSTLLVIVIAFNNKEIIAKQYAHLKKYVSDNFEYIVADNSSDTKTSSELLTWCANEHVSYVKIPKNPLTGIRASGSHGIALNWCYRNIIQKYTPLNFGFLDHDIFPLSTVSIIKNLELGFYGAIRNRAQEYWYLWPGFCFFTYSALKKYTVNFFPYHAGENGAIFLDTGGTNYMTIYKTLGRENVREAPSVLINLTTKKTFVRGEDSSQTFELIDSKWLHMRQIAWRSESSDKMNNLSDIEECAKNYLAD